jgi:DNA-binding transcriptional regulator YiaG
MSQRAEFSIRGRDLLAKPYHYKASGLDNIYLMNGFSVENTSNGPVVTIDNLNGLHHAIGLHIIEKPEPMTGAEFRFLRKQMELTQAELAAQLHMSDQTIANYEKGKTALGPADPFIRLIYLVDVMPDETHLAVLKEIAERIGLSERAKLPDIQRCKIVQKWREASKEAA